MLPSGAPGSASIRPCSAGDLDDILSIINAAAAVYEDAIPEDCWHDPYMSADQLAAEIDAGVVFTGYAIGDELAGVMGFQQVRDAGLVRHAYVLPLHQGRGIGGALIRRLEANAAGTILVGTWAAAIWAIAFYQRHGYALAAPSDAAALLKAYWTVSDRQIETSVVLAKPAATRRIGEFAPY